MGKHCILCAGKCILKSQYVTHLVGINYGKWHFNIWKEYGDMIYLIIMRIFLGVEKEYISADSWF